MNDLERRAERGLFARARLAARNLLATGALALAAILPLSAAAQNQPSLTITSASPANYFTEAGQTLTFHLTLWTGNAPVDAMTFTSGSPAGIVPNCPGLPADILTSVSCTFTYTTTTSDVALGRVMALQRFRLTRSTGAARTGQSNTFNVPYTGAVVPNITSLSPNAGALGGGNTVAISGSGLAWVSQVSFGGTPASFSASSDSLILATAPAGSAGTVNVTATTSAGTSTPSGGNQYTYVPPPTVVALSPSVGGSAGGTTVVITGANFITASSVSFGGHAAAFTINSNSQITATAPAGTGVVDVAVTNIGGTSASSSGSQYRYRATQTITFNNPGAQNFGTSPTLTASASSGLTVSFSSGTAAVCSITSGGTLTFNATGTCTIHADQAGDTNTDAATRVSQSFVVNAVVPGAPVIGTAVAGNGQATVSFSAPAFTGGSLITTYTVTSDPGAMAATCAASPCTVTGLTNGVAYTFTVTATNGVGTGAASGASNSVTPAPPVPVANPVSATVAHGSANNPITLNISGSAATSVSIGTAPTHGVATASGTSITYTPMASYSGPDSFTYTATNASGTSAPAVVTITVSNATVTYTPANPPAATAGVAYSQSLAGASGGTAPYSYAIASGALPAGVSLGTDGLLSGTPTVAGAFTFAVTARDSSTGTGPFSTTSGNLILNVTAPTISIAPGGLPGMVAGQAYSQSLSANGGVGPYTFSMASGVLPPGVSMSAAGVISGAPTGAGTFNFNVLATDANGFTGNRNYSLTVGAPVLNIVTPATLPTATGGAAYSQLFTTSGGNAPYSYAIYSGALPSGMTLSSDGTLSGTPTASGSFNFTVRSIDSTTGVSAPYAVLKNITLDVLAPTITVTPSTLPGGVVGVAFNQSLSATGGTAPYTYTLLSGALPPGVTLLNSGSFQGTPTSPGNFFVTVAYTDALGFGGTVNYTLNVAAPVITVLPSSVPDAAVGVAYSQSFTASGGAEPYTWSLVSGALPVGMSFNGAGVLTGTPVAAGAYMFTLRATDTFGSSSTQAVTLNVGTGAQSISNFVSNPVAPVYSPGGSFSVSATPGASTSPLVFASTTPLVCTVSGNTVSTVSAGTCALTANQAGDANYTAAPQVNLNVAITAASQVITGFASNPAAPVFAPGGSFTVSATPGASTAALVFGSASPAVCTVSGSTVTMLSAGNCALTANQAGDGNYTAAPQVDLNVVISAGAQAITGFAANPSAPVYSPGATFTISATPGASTAALVFASNTASVCSVSGSTVTILSAGNCDLTANQAGDANYTAAPEVSLIVPIGLGTQAISNFSASPAAPVFAPGASFTLSATAGASTSPLIFASTSPFVCTVSGNVVTMVSAGNCSLTANQAADANYAAAPQVSLNVVIAAADQSITNFVATPTAPVFVRNGTFAISATPGASTSPVVFASTSPSVCSVSGSTVTMLAAGNCALTANQAADANYTAAAEVTLSVSITAGTQVITNFAANPGAPVFAPNGTFAISATPGVSSSPLVFASTTASVCSVSGTTVTMLAAGTCSLTVNQAADANYSAAPQVGLNVVIGMATPVITWTGTIHKVKGSPAFDLPLPSSSSPGAFTFTSSNTAVASVSGRTVTIHNNGTVTITATQAATANYTAGTSTLTLVVDARPDPTLDPSVSAGVQAQADMSLRFANAQMDNVNDRLRQLRSVQGTPDSNTLTFSVASRSNGMSMPLMLPATGETRDSGSNGKWASGNIVYGQRDAASTRQGYDLHSDGLSFGADHAFGNFVLGGAIGMGWGDVEFSDGRSKQDARHRAFTLYGLWRGDLNWFAQGLLGWGQIDFDLKRWSTVANATATAERSGDQQYGAFTLGYTHHADQFDLTGYGRVEGNRTTLAAYRENGLGVYDLDYREQRVDSSVASLGIEGSFQGKLGDKSWRPFWSVEFRNALNSNGTAAINYVVLPESTDYMLSLRDRADRMWAIGGGFDLLLGRGWGLSFLYRREQANDQQNNVFGLRISYSGSDK